MNINLFNKSRRGLKEETRTHESNSSFQIVADKSRLFNYENFPKELKGVMNKKLGDSLPFLKHRLKD